VNNAIFLKNILHSLSQTMTCTNLKSLTSYSVLQRFQYFWNIFQALNCQVRKISKKHNFWFWNIFLFQGQKKFILDALKSADKKWYTSKGQPIANFPDFPDFNQTQCKVGQILTWNPPAFNETSNGKLSCAEKMFTSQTICFVYIRSNKSIIWIDFAVIF